MSNSRCKSCPNNHRTWCFCDRPHPDQGPPPKRITAQTNAMEAPQPTSYDGIMRETLR